MKPFVLKSCHFLSGSVSLPGDKSIAHRAVILASLSRGNTVLRNFPFNQDCLSTIAVFRRLGIKITVAGSLVKIAGNGLHGLKKPSGKLFIEESGTTFRLLIGILSGQRFTSVLSAGRALSRRPMSRVLVPLRMMGAKVYGTIAGPGRRDKEEYPPVTIQASPFLRGIKYKMPIASAQVKSALLLAGLYAKTPTEIIETTLTRDHTERMLVLFKAGIRIKNNRILVTGGRELAAPAEISIPGDISSAAFFIVAAAILSGSHLTIKDVSLNPVRLGALRVLRRMKAAIKVVPSKTRASGSEPTGDILIKGSRLAAVAVEESEIPSLIDELPVLMVAACFARGRSVFKGVGELRVKETDRIKSMLYNLNKMGASITVEKQNNGQEHVVVHGPCALTGARVLSFGDHRTAMSMCVAGLGALGRTEIDDVSCIDKSFPDFIRTLKKLFK